MLWVRVEERGDPFASSRPDEPSADNLSPDDIRAGVAKYSHLCHLRFYFFPNQHRLLLVRKHRIDGLDGFLVLLGGNANNDVQLAGTLVDHVDIDAGVRQSGEDLGGDALLEVALLQHIRFCFFSEA